MTAVLDRTKLSKVLAQVLCNIPELRNMIDGGSPVVPSDKVKPMLSGFMLLLVLSGRRDVLSLDAVLEMLSTEYGKAGIRNIKPALTNFERSIDDMLKKESH